MFAKVFIDTNASAIDSVYDYRLPENAESYVKPGMRVIVPFGAGSRKYQAIIVSISETTEYDEAKVKNIISVLDIEPVVPKYLIETAVFLRNAYFCNYSEAIRTVVPSIDKIRRVIVYEESGQLPENLTQDEEAVYRAVKAKSKADFTSIKLKSALPAETVREALAGLIEKGAIVSDEIFSGEYRSSEEVFTELAPFAENLEEALKAVSQRAEKQKKVLTYLFENGGKALRSELYSATGANAATLTSLSDKGLIRVFSENVVPKAEENPAPETDLSLNADQQRVLSEYDAFVEAGKSAFLLFGVTGSGKTRVFFEMFDRELKNGKQCLLLVPEIALTPQMTLLVKKRFGVPVAVMHSKLTHSERYAEFLKIKHGTARIVLGARSALFMPFKNPGLIVIDEEHENSYKSSSSPRYDTVETAGFICGITGAKLVLSSATPSIPTFYRAMRGEYEILRLPKRVNDLPMPRITIADMRRELKTGNNTPVSRLLNEKLTETLANGEQALLFLNRRGYNTCVTCRACGYTLMCPHCEVSLTYHRDSGKMICHYCGHAQSVPQKCPECGSEKIKFIGTGTEKIEKHITEAFPNARVMRLDSDVAQTREAYESILEKFAAGGADILIGTQMIVKGLDFSHVTLTGILLADASLNFPDINAAQRTYQLTAQAAGRSGRRDKPGQVVIQTYTPSAPSLVYCAQNDYEGFYLYDIQHRKSLSYPPYTKIAGIFCANENEQTALTDCEKIYERVADLIKKQKYVKIKQYEPSPAFIQKLKNKYIFHTLVVADSESDFFETLRNAYSAIRKGIGSTVFVEIDPITLL